MHHNNLTFSLHNLCLTSINFPQYKIFTNATYSSETDVIGFGAWQTIAHIPKITAGSNAVPFHDITSSNALFEIIPFF